ncbi:BA75_03341T0 [Komagataella pastoris]|uniref:Transcription factor BYE1 n=1 Tax=Komagataella pastoris TaxID=4922 RepID=A0A1B2JEE2_PICPA|nr:BA75_03341T0 [Komagataella pastoris]
MSEIRKSKRTTAGKRALTLDEELIAEERKKQNFRRSFLSRKPKLTRRGEIYDRKPKVRKPEITSSEIEDLEDEVRCLVCGTTEDDGEAMVQCDQCHTWQHNHCMFQENTIPESYICNVCDPHNEAYGSLRFEMSLIEYKRLKKNHLVPHSKGTIPNLDNQESIVEADNAPDSDFSEESNLETPEDDSAESFFSQESDQEHIILSKPTKKGQNTKHAKVFRREQEGCEIKSTDDEFSPVRKGIVKTFFKMFNDLLPSNAKNAEEWAVKLEYQLLLSSGDKKTGKGGKMVHSPGNSYTSKARTLMFNLKNPKTKLLERLIGEELTFDQLCNLTPEEMQTSDIKQLAKDVHTKAISQTVIENGMNSKPRAKITHKGEEIIDFDETEEGKASELFNNDQFPAYERGEEDSAQRMHPFIKSVGSSHQGEVEQKTLHEHGEPYNQNVSLYQNEYYSGEEDESVNHERQQMILDESISAIIGESFQDEDQPIGEADINDRSTAKQPSSSCLVWTGELIFSEISNFRACAHFVTSSTLMDFDKESQQCISIIRQFRQVHKYLQIEGRLNRKTALAYLQNCMDRKKYTLMIEFVPEESGEALIDEEHRNNFIRLFNYFYNRNRFGVIQGKGDSVKDAYLVPYQEGDEPEKVFGSFKFPNTIFEARSSLSQRLFGVFVTNL